jgi:asparagine synthase (glutamine-hydrolysing)
MCGIVALVGPGATVARAERMRDVLTHRGPDDAGLWSHPDGGVALGHRRLSIIDLSEAGRQPFADTSGRYRLVFNGELYNYRELRAELAGYPFRTATDTEVLLAAYTRWGPACLDRLIGMFAFAVWDDERRELFAARDRFGVKPLYVATDTDGTVLLASEIKALHAAGVPREPDRAAWATYLVSGVADFEDRTFWAGIAPLPAGSWLRIGPTGPEQGRWYDLVDRVGTGHDERDDATVRTEYATLLDATVRLRFRSDVPVGINLSGGLDSASLLATVDRVGDAERHVRAFTFVTDDDRYDELPWVRTMLAATDHPLHLAPLHAQDVPELALDVQRAADEPYGGIPTLAYARLFEQARADGVVVLLDGQGMDEQWAGYDYYEHAGSGAPVVQGSTSSAVRPDAVSPELRSLAATHARPVADGDDHLDPVQRLQVRDITRTKLVRALRFNDRISMRASVELREPFLDHRLVELALRQPRDRKIRAGVRKHFLRELVTPWLPGALVEAPKRPLQTPQREWLRGPLRSWVEATVDDGLAWRPDFLVADAARRELTAFLDGEGDNAHFVWQWVSLGLTARAVG